MSVREIHKSLVIEKVDGGLKESRDVENNIIISDYILRSFFTMIFFSQQDTRSGVVVNVVYLSKVYIHK